MAKREFMQLAHDFKPKHYIGGWMMSEKLDGIRAFWDGGISSSLPASTVPYANVAKDKKIRFATGLWSRYGKVIQAPEWWTKRLPKIPLDGELYTKRCDRQHLKSYVSKHVPIDLEWEKVVFNVFDIPQYTTIFADGVMNSTHFKKNFNAIMDWVNPRINIFRDKDRETLPKLFRHTYHRMLSTVLQNDVVKVLQQWPLALSHTKAVEQVYEFIEELGKGAEGAIIRAPDSIWTPERSHNLLKIKPMQDSEGIVVGYIWGKKTDKGSRHLGRMGSLIIQWYGVTFSISGFTDEERDMHMLDVRPGHATKEEGIEREGKEVSIDWQNPNFPRGTQVTFKYRQLTRDGVPEEARYMRKD